MKFKRSVENSLSKSQWILDKDLNDHVFPNPPHCSPHLKRAAHFLALCHSRRLCSEVLIQTQVDQTLTDSLPLSCMPFARRDSVFDLLSISSMIPWMWSPEIPWKSMAPGPGRNVQLPASVLQLTTSIYCAAALRPALSAHPNGLWGSGRGTQKQQHNPRDWDHLLARVKGHWKKRRTKKLQHGWDSGGGGGAPAFSFFPGMSPLQKKMYSPNDATNRCGSGSGGGEGGEEDGGEGGYSVSTRQKIMIQSFCCLFFWWFLSPVFAVKGSLLLGGQVGTAWIWETCPICEEPAKPAQSE